MTFRNTFGFFSAPSARRKRRSAKAQPIRPRRLGVERLEAREVMDATSPFYIVNESAVTDASKVNIAVYGQDYSSNNNFYYFDKTGAAVATSTLAAGTPIPTFTLADLRVNNQYVLNLPQDINSTSYGIQSARMYFGMNTPLSLTVNGSEQNYSVNGPTLGDGYIDFVEFSLNAVNNPAGNLNIDTTAVDQFGFPIELNVDSMDPNNLPDGVGVSIARDALFQDFQKFTSAPNDPFAQLIWPVSDPTYQQPYRISNPSTLLSSIADQTNIIQVMTTLQQNIAVADTTIIVYDTEAFPNPANGSFQIVVDPTGTAETMTVTAVAPTGDNYQWTVTRTNPVAHTIPTNNAIFVQPVSPAISATQTSVTVAGNSGFPTTFPFYMQVDSEIMQVTGSTYDNNNNDNNKDGTHTYNVVRGAGSTTPSTHENNALVHVSPVSSNPLSTYFNQAIDNLFSKYDSAPGAVPPVSEQLTVQGSDFNIYNGYVTTDSTTGCVVFRFKTADDATNYDIYYPYFNDNELHWVGYTPQFSSCSAPADVQAANVAFLPPSVMVFANNGTFADSATRAGLSLAQQQILGNLENQMVSALNRGVSLLPGYITPPSGTSSHDGLGDWLDSTQYYKTGPGNSQTTTWNHYAQFFHSDKISIDGKNYGFAYDDQQGHASDIAVANFNSVTITLGAWTAAQASNGNLFITGSNNDDVIVVQDLGLKGIKVFVNGSSKGVFKNITGEIFVDALNGNDLVSIDRRIKRHTTIDAGNGNDLVIGGGGVNRIHGGRGNDLIFGQKGRDTVLGGGGIDKIVLTKKPSYWSDVVNLLTLLSRGKKLTSSTFNLLRSVIQ